ncbi:MAG: DUF4832 domain-containing protein [Proteobacteria bacterium]|nr:DUF4832 domain-containing protein [Pseudomonadota bacterium]
MTRSVPFSLLAAVLLVGCGSGWEPVEPPTSTPADDDDATGPETVTLVPELLEGAVRNPDAGWIASNPNRDWGALTSTAGGDPFRVASVIQVTGTLREWYEPGDGSNPDGLANGNKAGFIDEAIDRGRYAALRLYADTVEDLPPAWPTNTDPPEPFPDGVIALVTIGEPTGDDDDSAGDDDDSAGDDDDSAGDDDDSAAETGGGDGVIYRPHYGDPDYFLFVAPMIAALGDEFGDEVGLAYVDVSGVGVGGSWDFEHPELWFDGGPATFSETSWAAGVATWIDQYADAFDGVPLFLPYRALSHAGVQADTLIESLPSDNVQIRDDCMGCPEPDFDRFPDEGSGDPYPADDPYGGFLPAELWPDHRILYDAALLDGLGAWRFADTAGTWDEGTYGSFAAFFQRTLDVRFQYAPPSMMVLSGKACTSEWMIAAAPPSTACGTHSDDAVWAPITSYGDQLGYRYVVTEVRLRPDWENLTVLDVEFDVANTGGTRAYADRVIEVALVDVASGEAQTPVVVEADPSTSQWGPGSTRTLTASIPLGTTSFDSTDAWALTVRFVEPRAFGGGISLPHATVGDEARHVLASWPAAE